MIPQLDDLRVRVGQGGELPSRRFPGVVGRMQKTGPHGGMSGHAVELAEALLRGLREKASHLIRGPLRPSAGRLRETGLDFPEGDTQKRSDHDNDDRRDEDRRTPSKGIPGPPGHRPPSNVTMSWITQCPSLLSGWPRDAGRSREPGDIRGTHASSAPACGAPEHGGHIGHCGPMRPPAEPAAAVAVCTPAPHRKTCFISPEHGFRRCLEQERDHSVSCFSYFRVFRGDTRLNIHAVGWVGIPACSHARKPP